MCKCPFKTLILHVGAQVVTDSLMLSSQWLPSCTASATPKYVTTSFPSHQQPLTHLQGYHNLSEANHVMHDPSLTPHGESQCRQFALTFPHHDTIELVVASPIRRTIYTALLAFSPQIERGMEVIALPEAQETSDLPSDTGSDVDVLRKEMAGKPVDLSLVREGWNSKKGKWAPVAEAVERRAREARRWLMARSEKEVVLVTHGGFLHYFTEDWSDSGRFNGKIGYAHVKRFGCGGC